MATAVIREIETAFWGQATVRGLEVTGDLFGLCHRFDFDGHRIEIAAPAVTLTEDLRPIAKQSHIAAFRRGLTNNPTSETNSYEIGYLDASIILPQTLTVPQALLDIPPQRPEIARPALSKELEALTIAYEERLAGAVAHWKDVVRWVTGSHAIDTPGGIPGRESESAFQFRGLVEYPGQKRFWVPPAVIAFQKQTELNAQNWRKIGDVLAAGHEAPVWSHFLDEAFRYLQNWDVSGCILSCAIACETLAKKTNSLLAVRSDGSPNKLAKKRPSMSDVIQDWEGLTGIADSDARTVEIRELGKIRNDLMHEGGAKLAADHATAKRLFGASRDFIRKSEDVYFRASGAPDPR